MGQQLNFFVILIFVFFFQVHASTIINPTKPNILLLLPDQWRYDWDGRDDSNLDLELPHFTSLANRGTRFLHAYTPSPQCAPSRSCMASGREYDQAGKAFNGDDDYDISMTTFYSLLRDEGGYHTMTVGKDDLTKSTKLGAQVGEDPVAGLYNQHELGFSDGRRCGGKLMVFRDTEPNEMYGHWLQKRSTRLSGFIPVNGYDAYFSCFSAPPLCTNRMLKEDWYHDTWIAQQAIDVLEAAPSNKPWFLQVNFAGPHPPFLVTKKQRNAVEQRTFPAAVDNPSSRAKTCEHVDRPQSSLQGRCDYAAQLEHLDELVGQILESVDESNTVICFSSDHGEMLSDHGLRGKTYPWQGSVGIPLTCAGPGIQQGATLEKPFVSIVDLPATFLDYAGIPTDPDMTSQSLRQILETGNDPLYRTYISSGLQNYPFGEQSNLPNGHYSWRMVVETRTSLKYICCVGKRCQGYHDSVHPNGVFQFLYNTTDDPFDMVDLSSALPQEMERLRTLLPNDFACQQLVV